MVKVEDAGIDFRREGRAAYGKSYPEIVTLETAATCSRVANPILLTRVAACLDTVQSPLRRERYNLGVSTTAPAPADNAAAEGQFTLRARLLLWLVSRLGYLAVRLIGPTLRIRVSYEEGAPTWDTNHGVWVFWHRCVFPATWHFRHQAIAVMTSRSFDGEYIARIIESFGFRAVRGSSSRGAVRALLGMHTEIEAGRRVAFTIDGPRGPKYVAKPGPVLLARNTQTPIVAFYISLEDPWVLNSWDQFMIPKPFSRAVLCVSAPIHVPRDCDSAAMQQYHADMQSALERVTAAAEQQLTR